MENQGKTVRVGKKKHQTGPVGFPSRVSSFPLLSLPPPPPHLTPGLQGPCTRLLPRCRLEGLGQSGPGNDLGCVTNCRNLGNFSEQQLFPTSKKNNTVWCLGSLSPLMCSTRGSPRSWNFRGWAAKSGRAFPKRVSENQNKQCLFKSVSFHLQRARSF